LCGSQDTAVNDGAIIKSVVLAPQDGLILTNKHVVIDPEASYTVVLSDGRNFPGDVLARDPFLDLAVIKIQANSLPVVELGDSDKLSVGQWVIAIGNALGEFRNTVTVGVISAKERTIEASGGGITEQLEGLIQTDAAINQGNSGGPLINLKGQVVGVNTATAGKAIAEGIGFAIPINRAKKDINQVKKEGRISRPYLGIRYIPLNKEIASLYKLPSSFGAWVVRGNIGEPPVIANSPADKAGIREKDIITHIDGDRIEENRSLTHILQDHSAGDEVELTLLRGGETIKLKVKLGEFK